MNTTPRKPGNVLEVTGLVTEFQTEGGRIAAVKGISFDLKKGETLAIVGESGSGKSVTALSVMNLIPNPGGRIAGGSISLQSARDGWQELTALPPDRLRHYRGKEISMVFQEPMTSLNPVLTCGYQVMEALLLHERCDRATARQRTIALFEQVKLPRPAAIFRAYPHEISGGQKQRVMIAMAISCHPGILIADEPTTALDVTVQAAILDLLGELQQRHQMAVLFITHDLGVVAEIADRILVMYKGSIVEQGTVEEIFRNPRHPYTKGLIACRPRLEVRMRKLPVIEDFMREGRDGKYEEIAGSVDRVVNAALVPPSEYLERQRSLQALPPMLEVRGLKAYFPQRRGFLGRVKEYIRAVDDIHFQVFPGETLGLVGESGCGKTTLGRTILRLQEPTAGEIFFQGKNITSISQQEMRAVRKDLQIIFQDPYSSLNPRMTIGSAILEPMQVHGLHGNDTVRKEKAIELLRKVQLQPEHFQRYPHEFSGGQRQRICIARALAVEPKFIVCDESVSALDVSVQAQVLNLLVRLRQEFGFTYIFISHDLSVVKFMSDRMMVMKDGKIEEIGIADEIYAHPQREYTRQLIAAIPRGDLASIETARAARRARRGIAAG